MDHNTVRTVYTAAACNQTPESLDWGRHNLIVYAATNAAVIYDPRQGRVLRTIVQHSARVNTVKWATNEVTSSGSEGAVTFVTGSDDHRCIVHHIPDVFDDSSPLRATALVGHTGGVQCIDTVSVGSEQLLIATAASDDKLKLWRRVAGNAVADFECFQTIEFKLELCLAVRLCELPPANGALLAVGAGDKVQLYAMPTNGGQFERLQTLCGHEDWVRGLDFVRSGNDLLLASSSQDTFIRLWKSSSVAEAEKSPHFVLESVLSGHDGWVYSVQWSLDEQTQKLALLSSSMDKTMILWRPADAEHDGDGIWSEALRVGDIGGHFLGFFGARMAPTRRSLLGHGYHGSFHLWQLDDDDKQSNADVDVPSGWRPAVMAAGGHFGEVRDMSWDPSGSYVLSVSADQTTRVHASMGEPAQWHELARPQVHGYDMQTIAVLGRYRFASGAEEKIVRTFQAPSAFVHALRAVDGVSAKDAAADLEGDVVLNCEWHLEVEWIGIWDKYSFDICAAKSTGATLPSLGLSNQPTIETTTDAHSVVELHNDGLGASRQPPTEETLMQNTLWPETQKLYGHGYEVYALCANSDGSLLASACKATSVAHAAIILWLV